MKPVHFEQVNKMLAAPAGMAGEVNALPVHTDGAQCVSAWDLDWKERLSVLLNGRIYLAVLSGATQPPVALVIGAQPPIAIPKTQNR